MSVGIIRAGDKVRVSTPGGGGFGDPLTRDPTLVLRDVRRGYYTAEQVAELFAVVIAKDAVDATSTEALRARRRHEMAAQ